MIDKTMAGLAVQITIALCSEHRHLEPWGWNRTTELLTCLNPNGSRQCDAVIFKDSSADALSAILSKTVKQHARRCERHAEFERIAYKQCMWQPSLNLVATKKTKH